MTDSDQILFKTRIFTVQVFFQFSHAQFHIRYAMFAKQR